MARLSTNRSVSAIAFLAAASLISPLAHAADAAPVAPIAAAMDGGGYYGQVPLLVDAASVLAFYGGFRYEESNHGGAGTMIGFLGIAGLMSGFAIGPINHARHQHQGRAIASVAMRLAGLVTFAAIEHSNTSPCQTQESPDCSIANRWLAEGLPWIALMAIDDGLLSWQSPRHAPPASPAPSFDAMVTVMSDRPGLMFAGTF
jgi:hypothetical protein